ncbi:LysR family transcriptional regulator [Methylovirgula sp. 4M-Z18]|uniref:LysR family transcriptional regulator n=1 Tax=Methylovirgula sp. 4M-Z18 TaxID=2293567 RepID=UPI000E2E72AE|nr:LysR family transcriptional regulator [Methylovirgula sp. 4M-Z18]RFB75687.1 LysR family transcriptional regulator [Methylovirgula sp. 4M-Z18]
MMDMTIHQLLCFDAIVTEGGFQAGAEKIGRTQPSVSAAVKNLEAQLGLALLDRSGYRVVLTAEGRSFHAHAQALLRELGALKDHAKQLAIGEETELDVIIGDLCPLPQTLALLHRFFGGCPGTRLNLHFEALSGPWERLLDGEADLILHHIDKTDPRYEFLDLFPITLLPVVAPGFLRFPISQSITPENMRDYAQCIIRDSARHSPARDYYLIEGARNWTVSDQLMKRELILQGMGWGHMPRYLIEQDLASHRLISIAGDHLRGGRVEIVAARRRQASHGPIANRLWQFIAEEAPALAQAIP